MCNNRHDFWDQISEPQRILDASEINEGLFSKVCDALYFIGNKNADESIIGKGGYYREGFYMLHPFYYLNGQTGLNAVLRNGIIFTAIRADADLCRLSIEEIMPNMDSDVIEYVPIVVFRNHRGDICYPGTSTDLSLMFHCYNDTYEFIGVYKAHKNSDNGHYKLTKIFDRYYFDSGKVILQHM